MSNSLSNVSTGIAFQMQLIANKL